MFRSRITETLRRLVSLDGRHPIRASANRRSANRSRLTVEGLEDRTVPALIEFYGAYGNYGYIGYNDGAVNPALASQTVAITDLLMTDGTYTFTEANVTSGGVLLSNGVYSGMDFWVSGAMDPVHIYGSATSIDVDVPSLSLKVYDDLPLTIIAPKVSVTAIANATEGGSNGTFHFTRTGDVSQPLTVNYTVGGTATSDTDSTALSGAVTFAAYSSTADMSVAAIDDVPYEPTETLTVTLASGTGYTVGSPNFASMSIFEGGLTPVYWEGGNDGDGNPLNDHDWMNPENWSSHAVPGASTAVYFDASHSNYSVTAPAGITLGELHLVNSYSGTVSLGGVLTVGKFELTSGAIAQDASEDMSVLGLFAWSGGTLNSTPSLATVNFYGGGSITLPGESNTLTTGSTLNFDSQSVGEKLTTIIGSGNFLLNGTSEDGIFIRGEAKVVRRKGSDDVLEQLGNKRITIEHGSHLRFVAQGEEGTAEDSLEGRIVNFGGVFEVRGGITVRLKGGNVNTPSYINVDDIASALILTNGSHLKVNHGIRIDGGEVELHASGPVTSNEVRITGKFVMNKGNIECNTNPNVTPNIYVSLVVFGDVEWNGGTFSPKLNGTDEMVGSKWKVFGTMTVTSAVGNPNKPKIEPLYIAPQGQQVVQGTWKVIEAGDQSSKLQGDNPLVPMGWTLVPDTNANGDTVAWKIKNN